MPEQFGKIRSILKSVGKRNTSPQTETLPPKEADLDVVAERIYQEVLTTIVALIRNDVNNTLFYPEDARVLTMLLKEEHAAENSVIRQNPIGLQLAKFSKSGFPSAYQRVRERSMGNLQKLSENPEHDELLRVAQAMSKLAEIGFRYTVMRYDRNNSQINPIEWIVSATLPEGEHTSLALQFFFIESELSKRSAEEFTEFVKKSPRDIRYVVKHPSLNQFQMSVNGTQSVFNWVCRIDIQGKTYQVYYSSAKETKSGPKLQGNPERRTQNFGALGLVPKLGTR